MLSVHTNNHQLFVMQFEANEVKRFFVVPPPGTTWMDVTIKDCRSAKRDGDGTTKLYVLHTVQLLPHTAYRESSAQKYINLLPSQTNICSIALQAGVTCEVVIGRYWATSGLSKADVSIEFHGVRPEPSEICFYSGDSFKLIQVYNDLRDETISPTAKVSSWKTALRPKQEGTISPLGERDIQPWNEKKTFQLILHYEFSQDEKGSFTPRAPTLQGLLYEATYESQLILAYDGDKRYLGFCGMFDDHFVASSHTTCKLTFPVHPSHRCLSQCNQRTEGSRHIEDANPSRRPSNA